MVASPAVSALPLLHAAALALWAGTVALALRPPAAAGWAKHAPALRVPATLLALFSAIALFHRHPEQWFSGPGKARAALVLGLIALDIAASLAGARAPRRLATSAAALAGLFAVAQISLTWVSPWKT